MTSVSHTEEFSNMIHRVAKNFGIIMAGQDGMIESWEGLKTYKPCVWPHIVNQPLYSKHDHHCLRTR